MSSVVANALRITGNSFIRRSFGLLNSSPTTNSKRCLTYKAAVLTEMGAPLVIKDVKTPKLAADELRIKVHACGVNNSDVLTCQAEYDTKPKLPFIPGFEVAGIVLEIGKNVHNYKVGDRIITINKEKHGGFAEQCVTHEKDVFTLPPELDFVKAASLVDCYATAYLGLVRRAQIEPEYKHLIIRMENLQRLSLITSIFFMRMGIILLILHNKMCSFPILKAQTVLVTAAAGGLGLAAVDLAANVYQAKVIGVCGHEKEDLVREKGAWAALTYNNKDIARTVNDVTEGKGVNVLFDAVGGDLFLSCLECVSHEGEVIVAGFASRQIPQIPTNLLLPKSFALIGVSLSHYRDANPDVYREVIEETISLGEQELIEPHVSATFKMEQVNEAFTFLRERKSTGKVVLTIAEVN